MNNLTKRLLITITATFFTCSLFAQVGTLFNNYEETNYSSAMKSANFTYLIWDRNNGTNGPFTSSSRPTFMYWDNDNSVLGYLVDTRNMVYLNAEFQSAKIFNGLNVTGGNVGIGTSIPDEKLTVDGNIHAEEVRVDLSVPGPDYVFEEHYNLPTLEEIEAFIKSYNHLPEIPSAKEMEADGVELGTMNMLLLKKIEELTLYMIEQQKENKKLNEMIENQSRIIDELRTKFEAYEK